MCNNEKVIGYWISEKKRQKLNWTDFQRLCGTNGFTLKMIDINSDLESQGPLHVFLYKLTETLAFADRGEENAKSTIARIKKYMQKHPEVIVIDPLENVINLRYRNKCYKMIKNGLEFDDITDVFTPNFVELKCCSIQENLNLLRRKNIKFPFLCKPQLGVGSSDAHKMMVIFNEEGLKNCQPPCVAQDFINHNAILYKVYVVGDKFHVVERPSLKNFYPKDCETSETIFFHSFDISKSGCKSKWSIISEEDKKLTTKPNFELIARIVKSLTKAFGLILIGIDVVIENHTQKYAIIDVNAFPGYDGYPHFFEHLMDCIKSISDIKDKKQNSNSSLNKCLNEDLDSGFESDEKKRTLNEYRK